LRTRGRSTTPTKGDRSRRPKTLEAILLHFVENMDAKANAFTEAMEDLREGARWTEYNRMFERYLFSGKFDK
jgi:3'-5' exoribonuclease